MLLKKKEPWFRFVISFSWNIKFKIVKIDILKKIIEPPKSETFFLWNFLSLFGKSKILKKLINLFENKNNIKLENKIINIMSEVICIYCSSL